VNAHGNDNVVYGNGERGRNSNIVGRCRSKWLNATLQMIVGSSLQEVKWLHVTHMW
jgi:hypothetical protein